MCWTLLWWNNIAKLFKHNHWSSYTINGIKIMKTPNEEKDHTTIQILKIEEWNEVLKWRTLRPAFGQDFGNRSLEVQTKEKGVSTYGWPLDLHLATKDLGLGVKSCRNWLRLPFGQVWQLKIKYWIWRIEALEYSKHLVARSATEGDLQWNFENQLWSSETHNRLVKFEKMVWQTFDCVFDSQSWCD